MRERKERYIIYIDRGREREREREGKRKRVRFTTLHR